MSPLQARDHPLLTAAACLFMGAVGLYSAVWMGAVRKGPAVSLGIAAFTHIGTSLRVDAVAPGGPADRVGIEEGDSILTIDRSSLSTLNPLARVVFEGRAGQAVHMTVRSPGRPAAREITLFAERAPSRTLQPLTRRLVGEALGLYPLLFLVVSTGVLLLRVDSRDAWLLALLFTSFIASAPYLESQTPPSMRGFALAFRTFFGTLSSGVFLYFFSVFPGPSPLDRRLPWLKRVWLGVATLLALASTLQALTAGPVASESWSSSRRISMVLFDGIGFGLGFASLVWTARGGPVATRRKARVVLWGTLAGFGPAFLLFTIAAAFFDSSPYDFPFWLWASCVIALALMPLSFAYAVVKHHVLEIPVLLRRGARYLLVQRGFQILLLLAGLAATILFASALSRILGQELQSMAIGLGTGFGTLLFVTGSQVQRRARERIDRAFFRTAYDARQILQDLAEKARAATSREELAALLEQQVQSALLPAFLAVYVETDGILRLVRGAMPEEWLALSPTLPLLSELIRRRQPRDVDESVAFEPLVGAGVESLVPILARDGRLSGLLALGPRLSDEPFSREDKRLLASVASQAGIALDSIHLAEQMAERREADRLANHEMELAKQVQRRLLVQTAPALETATLAGRCVQARAVGGDYYDFIDLGSGRVGLALADVSGKGFPAALLMASLQASLRSRMAVDRLDLPIQLGAVNHLLHRTSEANRFATLFFGVYDDALRTLRYANCGHNPPILLRNDGTVERLPPTAAALGLFETWPCETAEVGLGPGDLLAIFSDGVPEAFSDEGEEFGEARLAEALLRHRHRSAEEMVDEVLGLVTAFSGSEQEDDQTLVIVRSR